MNYEEAIDKLKEAFETQYKQAKGEEEKTPFLDTFPGDYADLDALLKDYFDTSDLNAKWTEIDGDADKSELKDGIKLRLRIVFLNMWKKALLRACAKRTDVDTVFDDEIACINIGRESLELTKTVLGDSEKKAGAATDA